MSTVFESANHVVVVTGAGFSAPSGLPVYRNGGANWMDGETERLSHASRYGNHLSQLWRQWHELGQTLVSAQPNAAHLAMARWEQLLASRTPVGSLTVVTQNVDGLHIRAGNKGVLEVHGTLMKARRLNGTELFDWTPDLDDPRPPLLPALSATRTATRRTRPDVVLFGEKPRFMQQATHAVKNADLVIFAGTSGQVWPVAGLLDVAHRAGVTTMLLNQTPWGDAAFAGVILDDVLALDQLVPSV